MSRIPGMANLYPTLTHQQICHMALRACPMSSETLSARLEGDLSAVYPLVQKGYVEIIGKQGRGSKDGVFYRLTPAGRAACPSRRALEAEVVLKYAAGTERDNQGEAA